MKQVFLTASILISAFATPALAQSYTLGDDTGQYTLPSGSTVGCITMQSANNNRAVCTMKLAGGDKADVFPVTVNRMGQTFKVIPESAAGGNKAWTDCGPDCIHEKP